MIPSLLIQFDPETLKPVTILPNGSNDEETEKLQKIADKMLQAMEKDDK